MKRTVRAWLLLFAFAMPSLALAFGQNAIKIPGLKKPASVARDVDGIAHVKATNQHDMFFLQGWTHAEDRLFQMDLNRR